MLGVTDIHVGMTAETGAKYHDAARTSLERWHNAWMIAESNRYAGIKEYCDLRVRAAAAGEQPPLQRAVHRLFGRWMRHFVEDYGRNHHLRCLHPERCGLRGAITGDGCAKVRRSVCANRAGIRVDNGAMGGPLYMGCPRSVGHESKADSKRYAKLCCVCERQFGLRSTPTVRAHRLVQGGQEGEATRRGAVRRSARIAATTEAAAPAATEQLAAPPTSESDTEEGTNPDAGGEGIIVRLMGRRVRRHGNRRAYALEYLCLWGEVRTVSTSLPTLPSFLTRSWWPLVLSGLRSRLSGGEVMGARRESLATDAGRVRQGARRRGRGGRGGRR